MKRKFKGFTLAEVLITLGIIGIVAAMTLPVITSTYRKKVIENRLKKFYTISNQAIKLSEVTNGDSKDWEVPDMSNPAATELWYNKYLKDYIKSTSITRNAGQYVVWIRLADGSGFGIRRTSMEASSFDVYFYPNPNSDMELADNTDKTRGKDNFIFHYVPGKGFIPYQGIYKGSDRNALLQACKNNINLCTRLLMFDNWEFKNDYPYKI